MALECKEAEQVQQRTLDPRQYENLAIELQQQEKYEEAEQIHRQMP